ncbi:pilin [Ramlibacter sp. G-1-2-2]|uniref:Pilin n=1 Tax=Ramlibacter agri TaxID=2728837 RepID=A0A848HHT6_9BURK|nr:pilin [Ramlibacter agri]NML48073.1 pilin [Ramlibacter agri]
MKKGRRGFTLIELMVALAVLVILMLATMPSYIDRLVRDQVTEALSLAEIAKPAIEAAWRAGTPLPADNAAAGLPPPEKIVNQRVLSVSVTDGAINIRFGNHAHQALQGLVLTLRPAVVEGAPIVPVTWLCGTAAPPGKMTAEGTNQTSVPKKFLPLACR